MSSSRPRVYIPKWPGPIEGYVMNYLRQNYWRVERSMEYDDCTQEAYIVFMNVVDRYGGANGPKHFMALFKTSWNNRFIDLTNYDSELKKEVLESQHDEQEDGSGVLSQIANLVGDLDHAGYLVRLIDEAPLEVSRVFSLFLNAPPEMVATASSAWTARGKRQKWGNRMLCKLLGIEEDTDVISAVTSYLQA